MVCRWDVRERDTRRDGVFGLGSWVNGGFVNWGKM